MNANPMRSTIANTTQPGPSLLEHAGARVKEFTQAALSAGQWHYHTQAWEHCYALDGPLTLEFDAAPAQYLAVGERCAIAPQCVHRVVNEQPHSVRYLVVQGPGDYDYHRADVSAMADSL